MRLKVKSVKEKLPIIITVVIVILICLGIFYFLENYEAIYYTQIDNNKLTSISSTDDMKYEYTLYSYNENGNKKEINFKTSRKLKEDACLRLEVWTIGVHSWEEIQFDELPEKVKNNYNK